MKKFSFLKVAIVALGVVALAFSCNKDDDDDPVVNDAPVLGVNFNYSVDANVVTFTTTLAGNVWWTNSGTDYPAVDKRAEVAFAEAGTYTFTCSILVNGVTLTSDPFNVVVEVGDATIYDTDYWKNLTGGYGEKRGWVLDVEAKVHAGPLSFLGTSWDFVAGDYADQNDAWMWDADLNFTFEPDSANVRMDWPGDEGYGVMYFDLINGRNFFADKKKEAPETGTYTLDWNNRTITLTGATILRSYKPFAQVQDDPNCEGDDCPKHQEDGINGISDWVNYKIFELTDTVLRLAVLRDQDVHGEGAAWLIYNFVEANTYASIVVDPPPVLVEPVLTSFTANDLVGTWKFDEISQDWIGWGEVGIGGRRLNGWNTRADMIATLTSWGAADAQAIFDAGDAKEFVFNADGSCMLGGVANNYTVTDGKIHFTNDLTDEFSLVWIGLAGKDVTVLDVKLDVDGNAYTSPGIWIGQKNGAKDESSSVLLVKQ